MSQTPTPVAEGSLANSPLSHVLLSIMKRELSGTLAVWPEAETAGQDRVLFRKGVIVAARLLGPGSTLERGLLPLFRRRGPYAFYEANLIGDAEGALEGRVDPAGLMTAALRGGAPEQVVDAILAKLGDNLLRVKGYGDLPRFALLPKEMAFVEMIRAAPASARSLIARSGQERMARRLVYLLAISGHLETFEGPEGTAEPVPSQTFSRPSFSNLEAAEAPPATAPASPASAAPPAQTPPPPASAAPAAPSLILPGAPEGAPPPPAELPAATREKWERLAALADGLDEMNYFDALEVGEAPTEGELRDAYFAKVKSLHPDRLPPELMPLKPWADRVFHYLTEAKDALADDERRIEHIRAVRAGGGTPAADRKLAAIVEAAMAYQKVEIFVRRKEWDKAMRILDLNIELSPDEADYHVMKAQVLHDRHGLKGAHAAQMNSSLERGLVLYPKHGRGNFLKASILKKSGREEASMEYFKKVLAISPRHLEAGREVRLYDMRHRKGGAGDSSKRESLFSKLLGKK